MFEAVETAFTATLKPEVNETVSHFRKIDNVAFQSELMCDNIEDIFTPPLYTALYWLGWLLLSVTLLVSNVKESFAPW